MKVLAQTFALFLAITPLLAAPVPAPSSDAVAETSNAHVSHHHHHHSGHHAIHHEEERSLLGEEELELAERSFDDEEAMLERRGSAMSSLKPKKKEEKSFEVTRRPGPKPVRQNSTGTAHSVQHVQHSGTERKGPLRVVNQKRGAAMSSLKPKKKEEKSFEVTRRPGPKPVRQNSTGTAHSVQHVQHSGTEKKGPLRVVNQKRGAAMSSLKPKKKEEKSFEVTRRPGPKPVRQNSTGTAHSVQHVQHSGTERKGPLRVVNQKRGAAMSSLKPKKKEEKSFEVTRRPGPKPQRQNSTGTAHSVQHVQHSGTERKGPLRVVNQKRGAAMSSLKPKKQEKGFEVTRRPGPKPVRQNSTGTAHSVQHVQHSGTERKGPLRVTNP